MASQYVSYDRVPNSYYQYSNAESEIFIDSSQMTIRHSRPPALTGGQRRIIKVRSPPKMAPSAGQYRESRQTREEGRNKRREELLECERVLSQRRAACLRERTRMRAMNGVFDILRTRLPYSNSAGDSNKRISKIDTLRMTIRYIRQLRDILQQFDHYRSQECHN